MYLHVLTLSSFWSQKLDDERLVELPLPAIGFNRCAMGRVPQTVEVLSKKLVQ